MVKIKAIILAAGYATRLYPLTQETPKPLIVIGEKPIVEHLMDKIKDIEEVDEVYVISNNKFYSKFKQWADQLQYPKKVIVVNDGSNSNEDRLGAIGDINFTIKEFSLNDDLLILGGDNIFEDDLTEAYSVFKGKNASVIALNDVHSLEKAKNYGVVSVDDNGKILEFEEKPSSPKSTLSATLVYLLKKEDAELITKCVELKIADRAGDFIKCLSEKKPVYTVVFKKNWFDIGSFESLEEANDYFKEDKNAR